MRAQGSPRGGQRGARRLRNCPPELRRSTLEHREAAAEPPGGAPEHGEEPNGGDAEGRRREGEANASRNRRNRLLEKARHVPGGIRRIEDAARDRRIHGNRSET